MKDLKSAEPSGDEWLDALSFEDRLNVVKVWAKYGTTENTDHEKTLFHLRWAVRHLGNLHALLGDPR